MEFLFILLKTHSKKMLTGLLSILCALILWVSLTSYAMDYSSLEIIFYKGVAGLMALFGIVMIVLHFKSRKFHEMDFTEDEYKMGNPYAAFPKIVSYLREITQYFMSEKITENMPIQEYVTQIHKNILDLHKKRLDRCEVQLEWKSIPRKYTKSAYQKKKYFEGKYEITEIDQQIESKRRYTKDHRKLMLRSDKELAHFTIINAKKTGENEIICPNCGCTTTRENLIDGCDYCGAHFTVEDLGEKFSDFTLMDNADLAYEKFKDRRLDRGYHAFLIFFWAMFAFIIFCLLIVMLDDTSSGGDPMNPLFLTFSVVGVSGSFSYLFALCFMVVYLFVIFPVTEIFRKVQYHTKKRVEDLKNHEEQDEIIQKKIQEKDPLFTLTGFYSNIQNKLNTIFYAETKQQLNAFSEEDLSGYHNLYKNVIDFDISEMNLDDYRIENGYQLADINTQVQLFELASSGKKVITKKQHIKIRMAKSMTSKTKAVCQPYILSCPNCGNSLSLLNGMICGYCGTKPDLREYDWTIEKYQIN